MIHPDVIDDEITQIASSYITHKKAREIICDYLNDLPDFIVINIPKNNKDEMLCISDVEKILRDAISINALLEEEVDYITYLLKKENLL
jgi:hypothetical protein